MNIINERLTKQWGSLQQYPGIINEKQCLSPIPPHHRLPETSPYGLPTHFFQKKSLSFLFSSPL